MITGLARAVCNFGLKFLGAMRFEDISKRRLSGGRL